jgi:alkylation response protein AidB-like acyl-CoA dehydrogenase
MALHPFIRLISADYSVMKFPTDREAKRRVLLDAVDSVREVVMAFADESEALGDLAPGAVRAMDEAGLFALKLPAELGGAEADPVTQLEVIERMTYNDPSAGWATMIGATSIGWTGAFLPDEAIAQIFAGGRIPLAAGIGGVSGTAVPVEGGYRLTGTFAFASGIPHAEWLIASARIVREDADTGPDAPPEVRTFVVAKRDATVHDDWQVAGLKGSGSNTFSTDDLFVPQAFTYDRQALAQGRPERGGPIFRLGMPGFTANEHAAFALGCGRRALDLILEAARTKRRGPTQTAVADRQVFQRWAGEADLRLRAARSLCVDIFEQAWQWVSNGAQPDARLGTEMRAVAVFATDAAVDVTTSAFRYAGGAALHLENELQRYWRDVNAAAQHQAASDVAFEAHGQGLLGLGEAPVETGQR